MKEISEIRLNAVAGYNNADLACRHCLYAGEVIVDAEWPVFSHPNQTLIVRSYVQYLKFLEICPKAIHFVTEIIDTIFCPACGKTQLHITTSSKYNLAKLHASFFIHQHATIRTNKKQ